MTIIDISLTLGPELPVFPGEPGPDVRPLKRLAAGQSSNLSAFSMGVHCGTHLDAPWHKIEGGTRSSSFSLETLCGPATVILVNDPASVRGEHLSSLSPAPERLLIRTRNSGLYSLGQFTPDYVYIDPSAAEWAVENSVRLIGFDYLSVEKFREPGSPTHRILLAAGVTILEGLDLSGVSAGDYSLLCLPLKLPDADGAPARAVLHSL